METRPNGPVWEAPGSGRSKASNEAATRARIRAGPPRPMTGRGEHEHGEAPASPAGAEGGRCLRDRAARVTARRLPLLRVQVRVEVRIQVRVRVRVRVRVQR